jgi:hypothetical protein
MRRVAGWTFVFLLAVCGVAQGKQPANKLSRWSAVEALPQDTLIEVGRQGWAGVDQCRVESVDDSALTCVAERPEGNARLVFPRDAVRAVSVIEPARNLHIGRWIMVGAGVALVAAAGVGSGVFGLAIVGPLVVGIEISYFENFEWNRPPQMPRMRRRLVYAAPWTASLRG